MAAVRGRLCVCADRRWSRRARHGRGRARRRPVGTSGSVHFVCAAICLEPEPAVFLTASGRRAGQSPSCHRNGDCGSISRTLLSPSPLPPRPDPPERRFDITCAVDERLAVCRRPVDSRGILKSTCRRDVFRKRRRPAAGQGSHRTRPWPQGRRRLALSVWWAEH